MALYLLTSMPIPKPNSTSIKKKITKIFVLPFLSLSKETSENLKSFWEDNKEDLFGQSQVTLQDSKKEPTQKPTRKPKEEEEPTQEPMKVANTDAPKVVPMELVK